MNFKVLFIGLLVGALASCVKVDTEVHPTKVLGHAGNGLDQWNGMFAANSLESVQYALNFDNCKGVEIDVRVSKDSTLWLIHDEDLSLRTNGSGLVSESTDAYLETIKYKSLQKEKLIKLQDVLDLKSGKHFVFDLKNYNEKDGVLIDIELFKRGFEKLTYKPINKVINIRSLDLIDELEFTELEFIHELNDVDNVTFDERLAGYVFHADDISAEDVAYIQSKEFEVYLFGVRTASRFKKERNKAPDYIMVDDVMNASSVE